MKGGSTSSGWLEYLSDSSHADFFAPAIEDTEHLVVPSISLLEVFKRVLRQMGEEKALQAVTLMMEGTVVDLDADLAVSAAVLGYEAKLPLADSVILATARKFDAIVWTQDSDFKDLAGVRYISQT